MKLNDSDFDFAATPTQVDEEEKARINQSMKRYVNRSIEVAKENHTRDSVVYIESAEELALMVLDLPTAGIARQVADSVKNSTLPQLIDRAKANGFAPQGALPSQPPVDMKQPTDDTVQQLKDRIEELERSLSYSEQWRGELLAAAGLDQRPANDLRGHHDAVEKLRGLRSDAGPRRVDVKQSQEYIDLEARATEAENNFATAQAALNRVNETHVPKGTLQETHVPKEQLDKLYVPREAVLTEAGKLAEVGPTFPRRTPNDEEVRSEQARKALLDMGKPRQNQGTPQRTPRPRGTA